ncbi:MAG TPA: hypothetical protein VFD62_17595 [Pyrinomonadaceae bacterium]|nr:hypothetical protein [Pyrinomonadaceae bacterium]
MSPSLRRLALTAHITSTLGWLGAIVGFLALAIAARTSPDVELVRGAYLAMELTGWYVLVPLCIASLVTGLIMSLGTPWGLFRHYWVLVKFVITVLAAVILFMYTQTLEQLGATARDTTLTIDALRNGSPVLHSGLAVLALLVNTTLSVYKPRGMTKHGRRKQREQRDVGQRVNSELSVSSD